MKKGIAELIAGLLVIAFGIYLYNNARDPELSGIPVFNRMNVRTAMYASAITIVIGIIVVIVSIRQLNR